LKNFWGFGANAILMNHLWDFPGLLDRTGLFWDLGAKIYFKTKNRKLVRKIKLVQGWPRNGAQIRKLQNTEVLGKALQSPNFDRILT
jgi:hypothetical protein